MDIFSIANQLFIIYRQIKAINNLFVNRTASLIDQIGCIEFNAAIKCLHDAEISNVPEREFISALTLLKSSVEKFKIENKYKFQGTLIIGVCYKLLQEDTLSRNYLENSKTHFIEWINKNRPYVGISSNSIIWSAVFNHSSYSDFKKEIVSFGLKWQGEYPFMFGNPVLMNEDISVALKNAIKDYSFKVDHLFDPPPEYKCVCKKCNREVRLIEPDLSSNKETVSFLLLIAKMFDYKVLTCECCGSMFHINTEGKIVCIDKNGTNK